MRMPGLLIVFLVGCTEPSPLPLVDLSEGPPNIIIIGLDTFRADHIGAWGNSSVKTPALDRFAAESIVFEDCASTSTWTLPSFASLFTGKLPSEHAAIGGDHRVLPEDEITLAQRLKAHRYHTTAFVAVDYLDEPFGLERGFDRIGKYSHSPVNGRLRKYERRLLYSFQALPREPWFLFVHYFDAHDPYQPPDEFGRMYYDGDPEVEPRDPARSIDVIYSARNRIRGDPRVRYRWLEGIRDLEFPVREYAGGISYVDHHVGVVLDSLRAGGLMDESIVMVVADHGEHLTEHDIYFTHRLPYAECLQVPLMIRLPHGVQSGRRVSAPVSLADVLPTLMELVGISVEQELSGQSLVGLMRGEDAEPRVLFAEFGAREFRWAKSVWDADWRYTEIRSDSSLSAELFDRRMDPREEHDLAGARPELVEFYSAVLDARFGVERRLLQDAPDSLDTPDPVEVDPLIEERLRALGYVDGGGR